ncbi:hypothetical protein NQ318_022504 [Aromia moschata]|uniref:Uncharacterized protein n=1 Tax=Aromia moschata TaxID=1265417 RepID=A0AAV8Z5B2_9CUCU|nr:hypothetical protein NQ318_022504 [Aromia moschata]
MIRWGDKDGGYGEHYYDFNHDTHSPQQVQQQPEPQYYPQESRQVPQLLRVSSPLKRLKREGLLNDVEFINDKAKALILNGKAQKHGGNYQSAYDYDRGKREENKNNEDEEEEEEEDEYSY